MRPNDRKWILPAKQFCEYQIHLSVIWRALDRLFCRPAEQSSYVSTWSFLIRVACVPEAECLFITQNLVLI